MPISIETAQSYRAVGLSVLPAVRAKKCPATGRWKTWKSRLPTDCEIRTWFSNYPDAVCIIAGAISGNLEIIDFDNHGELYEKWRLTLPADLLAKLVIERTPSGGYHVIYRCESEVCGNIKLAQGVRAGKLATLIETRGEGGLFLCAPTDGYMLIQNDFSMIATLAEDDRSQLLTAAWNLNEHTSMAADWGSDCGSGCGSGCGTSATFAVRPGDAFNQTADLRGLLLKHGWTPAGKSNGGELFKRPGKNGGGCSASLKDNVFYVFSSNAAPFEANKGYSAFQVYAQLEHAGDFTAAANTLLAAGYGTPSPTADVDLSQFKLPEKPKPRRYIYQREMEETYTQLRPPLIHGLLREGETMNIIASPKIGKSWLVLDLAEAVATGRDWLGFPCEQGKVLIIDNELHPETSSDRIRKVRSARNIPISLVGQEVAFDNQRGELQSINQLAENLGELKEDNFKLIIIDAFYRALPDKIDENDNAGIARIYNLLDRYAKELHCSFVLIHHTSKGNQAMKGVTDVGSGAGSLSRAADTHVILRRHQTKDIVVMDSVVRSFLPNPPVCLRWDFPVWNVDLSLDPNDLDGTEVITPKPKKQDIGELAVMVAEIIPQSGAARTQFVTTIQAQLNIGRDKARQAVDVAIELGLLEQSTEIDAQSGKAVKKIIPTH